jgi:hypothetical protein
VSKQYGFLSDRHHTKRNYWAINVRCPLKRHELRRKGFLRLGANGTWTAQDTQSFHALRYNRIIGCYHREYPMGWALVTSIARTQSSQDLQSAADTEPQNFSKESFWRWVGHQAEGGWNIFSGGDNRLARRWASTSEIRWRTQGMPSYTALTPKRQESLRLAILVKQQSALIHRGTSGEESALEDVSPSRKVTAFNACKQKLPRKPTLHHRKAVEALQQHRICFNPSGARV